MGYILKFAVEFVTLKWIFGVEGVILVLLGAFWVACWVSWVAAGGQGVPLCAFGAQSSPKTTSPFRGRPLLDDFGAQRVPRRFQTLN